MKRRSQQKQTTKKTGSYFRKRKNPDAMMYGPRPRAQTHGPKFGEK